MTDITYKKEKKYNYVYVIKNKLNGMMYIGSRGSNINPLDDLKKYRTSSRNRDFKFNLKMNPEGFEYTILSTYTNRDDAFIEEQCLHELYNVKDNPLYYNRHNHNIGGFKFNTTGKVVVKDKAGNIMQIYINDERYINGELVHISTGMKRSDATIMNMKGSKNIKMISGHNNSSAKAVSINDTIYYYILDAVQQLGISKNTLRSRCLSNDPQWKDWFYIDNETHEELNFEKKVAFTGNRHTKETKNKISEHHKGKIISDETKKKLSIACSGKNNKKSKPVSINGVIYDAGIEAIKIYKISKMTLKNRCLSNDPQWKDWFYVEWDY